MLDAFTTSLNRSGGKAVHEDVVHHGAVAVAEGGILGVHVLQLVHVVHGGALQEAAGALARNEEVSHVGNVEEADGLADGFVLLADSGILHRHVESGERHHLGA